MFEPDAASLFDGDLFDSLHFALHPREIGTDRVIAFDEEQRLMASELELFIWPRRELSRFRGGRDQR